MQQCAELGRVSLIRGTNTDAIRKGIAVYEQMSTDRQRISELEAEVELAHKGYEELQDLTNSLIRQRDKYAAALQQWRWFALMVTALLVGCFIGWLAGEAWGGK
jgi:F0F1-type ATP synthase assembly protein I